MQRQFSLALHTKPDRPSLESLQPPPRGCPLILPERIDARAGARHEPEANLARQWFTAEARWTVVSQAFCAYLVYLSMELRHSFRGVPWSMQRCMSATTHLPSV